MFFYEKISKRITFLLNLFLFSSLNCMNSRLQIPCLSDPLEDGSYVLHENGIEFFPYADPKINMKLLLDDEKVVLGKNNSEQLFIDRNPESLSQKIVNDVLKGDLEHLKIVRDILRLRAKIMSSFIAQMIVALGLCDNMKWMPHAIAERLIKTPIESVVLQEWYERHAEKMKAPGVSHQKQKGAQCLLLKLVELAQKKKNEKIETALDNLEKHCQFEILAYNSVDDCIQKALDLIEYNAAMATGNVDFYGSYRSFAATGWAGFFNTTNQIGLRHFDCYTSQMLDVILSPQDSLFLKYITSFKQLYIYQEFIRRCFCCFQKVITKKRGQALDVPLYGDLKILFSSDTKNLAPREREFLKVYPSFLTIARLNNFSYFARDVICERVVKVVNDAKPLLEQESVKVQPNPRSDLKKALEILDKLINLEQSCDRLKVDISSKISALSRGDFQILSHLVCASSIGSYSCFPPDFYSICNACVLDRKMPQDFANVKKKFVLTREDFCGWVNTCTLTELASFLENITVCINAFRPLIDALLYDARDIDALVAHIDPQALSKSKSKKGSKKQRESTFVTELQKHKSRPVISDEKESDGQSSCQRLDIPGAFSMEDGFICMAPKDFVLYEQHMGHMRRTFQAPLPAPSTTQSKKIVQQEQPASSGATRLLLIDHTDIGMKEFVYPSCGSVRLIQNSLVKETGDSLKNILKKHMDYSFLNTKLAVESKFDYRHCFSLDIEKLYAERAYVLFLRPLGSYGETIRDFEALALKLSLPKNYFYGYHWIAKLVIPGRIVPCDIFNAQLECNKDPNGFYEYVFLMKNNPAGNDGQSALCIHRFFRNHGSFVQQFPDEGCWLA